MRLATPLALLVVVLAAAVSFAVFQKEQPTSAIHTKVNGKWAVVACSADGKNYYSPDKDGACRIHDAAFFAAPVATVTTHPMGPQCDPSYPAEVCRTTVEQLKALEGTEHQPITVDWQKQQSIFISGSKPFTLHIKALDGGVEPFYRSFPESRGKELPSNSVSTGPARKEAGGHSYQLIFRDENGDYDPHIVIVPAPCGTC
jgi:hypothetical protein